MKTVKVKLILMFALVLVLSYFNIGQQLAYATTQKPLTNNTYSIKPVLPKNQNPAINNYFSLTSEGDLKGTYDIEISNDGDEELTLYIQSLNAFTSPNGLIQYADDTTYDYDSFIQDNKYKFTDYVDIVDVVTVKPNTVSRYSFNVNIPKMEGSILGAISFRTALEGGATSNEEVSITINNAINNVIAFNVDFGNGAFNAVEYGEATLYHSGFDTHIKLPIRAMSNTLVENAYIEYKVINEDGDLVFENPDKLRAHIVSNADFDMHLPWLANTVRKNNNYELIGSMTLNYNGEEMKFPFNKKFEFKQTENKTLLSSFAGGVELEGDRGDIFMKYFTSKSFLEMLGYTIFLCIIFFGMVWSVQRRRKVRASGEYHINEDELCSEGVEEDSVEEYSNDDLHKLRFLIDASEIYDNDLVPVKDELFDDVLREVQSNYQHCYLKLIDADSLTEINFETFPFIEEDDGELLSLNDSTPNEVQGKLIGIYMKVEDSKSVLNFIVVPF